MDPNATPRVVSDIIDFGRDLGNVISEDAQAVWRGIRAVAGGAEIDPETREAGEAWNRHFNQADSQQGSSQTQGNGEVRSTGEREKLDEAHQEQPQKVDKRSQKPKKERSSEGAVDQLKGLQTTQKDITKKGGYRISTKKSEQNIDIENKKFKSSKDLPPDNR